MCDVSVYRGILAYCKSIWRWKNTLNRYLWQYCSLPRQLLVLLDRPIRGQHSHHLTLSPPMGGEDRWLMIILDGSFISIFSLWARLIMWCMSYGDCVGGDRPQHYNRYLSEYQALSSLLSTHSISCNPHSYSSTRNVAKFHIFFLSKLCPYLIFCSIPPEQCTAVELWFYWIIWPLNSRWDAERDFDFWNLINISPTPAGQKMSGWSWNVRLKITIF